MSISHLRQWIPAPLRPALGGLYHNMRFRYFRARYRHAHTLAAETLGESTVVCPLSDRQIAKRRLLMAVHPKGDMYVSEYIKRYGIWEAAETQFLLENLSEGDTFIDVGANIGYFAILASSSVGSKGKVIAFEPDPRNFAILALNARINGARNLQTVQAAVSDEAGEGELVLSDNNFGDHRLHEGALDGRVVRVPTVMLDGEMLHAASGRVFLKIDTQGWESRIVFGNRHLLGGVDYLLTEWSPRWVAQNGHDPLAMIRLLHDEGFDLRATMDGRGIFEAFSIQEAQRILPALMDATGQQGDPMFVDIAATRRASVLPPVADAIPG